MLKDLKDFIDLRNRKIPQILQYHPQKPSLCLSSLLRSLFYKGFIELIHFYEALFNRYESKAPLWEIYAYGVLQ